MTHEKLLTDQMPKMFGIQILCVFFFIKTGTKKWSSLPCSEEGRADGDEDELDGEQGAEESPTKN